MGRYFQHFCVRLSWLTPSISAAWRLVTQPGGGNGTGSGVLTASYIGILGRVR
jgi:hypothetical protein